MEKEAILGAPSAPNVSQNVSQILVQKQLFTGRFLVGRGEPVRLCGTAKPAYASPEVVAPRAAGSRTIPGVNDIKTTVLEVCNIARGELGPSHLRNGRDLRIRVADRSTERTSVNSNLRKNSRCFALEPEDVARQILGKHGFRRCQQPLATLALGEQLNSI